MFNRISFVREKIKTSSSSSSYDTCSFPAFKDPPWWFLKPKKKKVLLSRDSLFCLLEIQAETAMNHILIDSTGEPRDHRVLPFSFAFTHMRRGTDGKTFASGITKNVWSFTGKSLALKMKESTRIVIYLTADHAPRSSTFASNYTFRVIRNAACEDKCKRRGVINPSNRDGEHFLTALSTAR